LRLANYDFHDASAAAEESEVSSSWAAFSGQALQMALRIACSQSPMLQAEVLWHQEPSVRSNDTHCALLQYEVPFLLADSKRRFRVQMG
jgi:hypothetical protein